MSIWKLRFVVFVLLFLFSFLLLVSLFQNSPVQSEDAHLASGVSHHEFLTFDLYRVNPPLVRGLASLPVYLFCTNNPSWEKHTNYSLLRREHQVGVDYLKANSEHACVNMNVARISCMVFALLGGVICFVFAQQALGTGTGILTLLLWCFSPYILAQVPQS